MCSSAVITSTLCGGGNHQHVVWCALNLLVGVCATDENTGEIGCETTDCACSAPCDLGGRELDFVPQADVATVTVLRDVTAVVVVKGLEPVFCVPEAYAEVNEEVFELFNLVLLFVVVVDHSQSRSASAHFPLCLGVFFSFRQ